MNKRVGISGLLLAATVALFHPAVASAQDRYDDRGGYAQREYRDRDYRDNDSRRDNRFRDQGFREERREDWREAARREEWRERERCERQAPPVYSYRYRAPAVGFGFRWYGR